MFFYSVFRIVFVFSIRVSVFGKDRNILLHRVLALGQNRKSVIRSRSGNKIAEDENMIGEIKQQNEYRVEILLRHVNKYAEKNDENTVRI